MGKRRFSEIVATVIRSQKAPNLGISGSLRHCTTIASPSQPFCEDDVRLDVKSMATGAAGLPVDDLIRPAIPTDSFWQPDLSFLSSSEALAKEVGPSRSSPMRSNPNLSGALASPASNPRFVQSLATASPRSTRIECETPIEPRPNSVFFLRSDADSLRDVLTSSSHSSSDQDPPTPPAMHDTHPFSVSPEQPLKPASAARSHWMPASGSDAVAADSKASHHLTSSPSQINGMAEPAGLRPPRPSRPTLTRLNTSEMLRTQTTTDVEPAPVKLGVPRRSPTGLKLQLDTSVPRRSATMSSYPHAAKTRGMQMLHPPLPLFTPPTPVSDLFASETHAASSSEMPSSSDQHLSAPRASPHMGRNDFNFEDFDFEVSTILPDFLFLGPNISSEQDIAELRNLGVKRILNVAYEIEEQGPLKLKDQFDKYLKLPMLDSVEAKGVQDSIKEACSFLDDARLRSEPVYVHCKAGKSRSVTIVIAYLIHALRWSLQKSYSHVVEKRAAISPNIGFVAELMRYEEMELKLTRSSGIYGSPAAASQSPVSKSSPHLLSGMEDKTSNGTQTQGLVPPFSSHAAMGQRTRASQDLSAGHDNDDKALGGQLSKSFPDLPSLAFASK